MAVEISWRALPLLAASLLLLSVSLSLLDEEREGNFLFLYLRRPINVGFGIAGGEVLAVAMAKLHVWIFLVQAGGQLLYLVKTLPLLGVRTAADDGIPLQTIHPRLLCLLLYLISIGGSWVTTSDNLHVTSVDTGSPHPVFDIQWLARAYEIALMSLAAATILHCSVGHPDGEQRRAASLSTAPVASTACLVLAVASKLFEASSMSLLLLRVLLLVAASSLRVPIETLQLSHTAETRQCCGSVARASEQTFQVVVRLPHALLGFLNYFTWYCWWASELHTMSFARLATRPLSFILYDLGLIANPIGGAIFSSCWQSVMALWGGIFYSVSLAVCTHQCLSSQWGRALALLVCMWHALVLMCAALVPAHR
jgi:hypothetical protein